MRTDAYSKKDVDEEAIRRDVEAIIRRRLTRMHERATRLDGMSDEEYRAHLLAVQAKETAEWTKATDEQIDYLVSRRSPSRFANHEFIELAIKAQTDQVLPIVLANREKSNAEGAVTEEELRIANDHMVHHKWRELRESLLVHIAENDDPARLEKLQALLAEAEVKIQQFNARCG